MIAQPVYASEPIQKFAPRNLFPDVATIVNLGMNLMTFVGGILVLATFVYGCAKYLSSNGNPDEIMKAQRYFLYAVIGFVVIIAAYTLSRVYISALGAPDPFAPPPTLKPL
jgi:Na+-driven multidrug efflux pump